MATKGKKINVYDTIVRNKDWKEFRKTATEEELTVLAIGSRYRMHGAQFFIKAAISVIGMIVSVVVGLFSFSAFGFFSVVILVGGYLFFNLLASKLIGYTDAYSSCCNKISKQSREHINELFHCGILQSFLRGLVVFFLGIVTIPYKAILMLIDAVIPAARDWTIAHGSIDGVVITMPEGYDIGNLKALGDYYASCSFFDAWQKQIEIDEKKKIEWFLEHAREYKYIDEFGSEKVAYSADGRTFYETKEGRYEIGTSNDGGKTIDFK